MPHRWKQCVTKRADRVDLMGKSPQNPLGAVLIGDSAVTAVGHLTTFLRAEHAGKMT